MIAQKKDTTFVQKSLLGSGGDIKIEYPPRLGV